MADGLRQTQLRALPAVDTLRRDSLLDEQCRVHGQSAVAKAIRQALDAARAAILRGETVACDTASLAQRTAGLLTASRRANLRPVFNLTGTVLHTNLGRAPLAPAAVEALRAAAGACNVEYDLVRGARGQRDALVEGLLCELIGAEAAVVVNNNAAAVLLVLNALAMDREVIVSRGELIEIGDAFRMPDIMTRAGCRLREVGTTNRTHEFDYENAIGADTGLLMTVWPSNYEIQGFTGKVSEAGIARIAHAHGLPFAVDLGSGSLIEMTDYGLPHEPTPRESLAAGADLVTFSGDKLLGGPQSGLIVGKREFIDRVKRNPLKRALRCDKLILAALEATLRLYIQPERLAEQLPTLRLLTRSEQELDAMGQRLLPRVQQLLTASTDDITLVPCESQIGSGSLPVDLLPSRALRIAPPAGERHPGTFLKQLTGTLATLPMPVIGRTVDNALQLDLRCLEDEAAFLASLDYLHRSA